MEVTWHVEIEGKLKAGGGRKYVILMPADNNNA